MAVLWQSMPSENLCGCSCCLFLDIYFCIVVICHGWVTREGQENGFMIKHLVLKIKRDEVFQSGDLFWKASMPFSWQSGYPHSCLSILCVRHKCLCVYLNVVWLDPCVCHCINSSGENFLWKWLWSFGAHPCQAGDSGCHVQGASMRSKWGQMWCI